MEPGFIIFFFLTIAFVAGILHMSGDKSPVVEEKKDIKTGDQDNKPVDLNAIARDLETPFEQMAHPGDALKNSEFERGVAAMAGDQYSIDQLRKYALGSNWVLQCMGFEALTRRTDAESVIKSIRSRLGSIWAWPLFFAIRLVDTQSKEPEIGNILACAREWWWQNPMICDELSAIFKKRLDGGEKVTLPENLDLSSEEARQNIQKLVETFPTDVRQAIESATRELERIAIDYAFLRSVGEILTEENVREAVFVTQQISNLRDELIEEIDDPKPRSILVVGESGVGKSAFRRLFARTLQDAGWKIFKTSAANIIADKVYIGEIEGQVRKLSKNATVAKRVAVYVDRLSELDEFGRHNKKNSSVLDQLWPMIESRDMFFVSEMTPSSLQALLRRFPTLQTVMKIVRLEPATEDATTDMAESLLDVHVEGSTQESKDEVVAEALQLSQQYLSHKALPGSVLSLVELAVLRARRSDDDELNRVHVLGALSQISGLPKEVLDERQTLDVAEVRGAFTRRIIGQDEGVDCLVERIAMLKAGLTDPSRPVGVFLFAGPTGTGKTEIAKTLADLLFGSPEQMIRLDMSEYQNADSAWRLIGESENSEGASSLAAKIREQPFSVVLLDEFEKAHVKVWDMFLQVFDDGRLTDSSGSLADFRHSIIILTSNLGSTISNEAGIGFTSTRGDFSKADVMKAVNRTFRREFINRLDRVVVFNPLDRDVMRSILHKELDLALGRRGLRTKQWAVEWEDSAIEFLLDEGFTPDLGARPLRRAIERHLLTPLSITMVQNEAPAGEQFLFVRSNGEALQVEFIDPDEDESEVASEEEELTGDLTIATILQSRSVSSDARSFLAKEMTSIQDRIDSTDWANGKNALIEEMNSNDFWDRDDRHAVMDRIELVDRIDSATSVLSTLAERMDRTGGNAKIAHRVANRIFVLREGLKDFDERRSTQAIIGVRLVTGDVDMDGALEFRDRLSLMYRNWARARGMRLRELDSSKCRYESLFLVSGFGSFGLLEPESGLHVFEVPAGKTKFDRIRARVEVAPVPTDGRNQGEVDDMAADILDADTSRKVEVVRRYREEPSPLARDSVRHWRTGRLEFIFDGNFDVIS